MKSRWADDDEDAAAELQRKKEKEEKKRAKAEKQRKADEEAAARLQKQQQAEEAAAAAKQAREQGQEGGQQSDLSSRPAKRRKLSPEREGEAESSGPVQEKGKSKDEPAKLLRFPAPTWKKCRSVEDYEKLNDIEEGAYGWVSRAKDMRTGEVVALKRLKMDNAQDGIPVTGLREIQTLRDCVHPNIVGLKEVVVGEDTRKIEKYVYPLPSQNFTFPLSIMLQESIANMKPVSSSSSTSSNTISKPYSRTWPSPS